MVCRVFEFLCHSLLYDPCRYFNRDVECIRSFFKRRFRYESALYPRFRSTLSESGDADGKEFRLDVVVAASGFGRKEMQVLEQVSYSVFLSVLASYFATQYMEATKIEEPDAEEEEESESEEVNEEEEDDGELSKTDGMVALEHVETPQNIPQGNISAAAGEFSDPPSISSRQISRSPPQSRSPSPSSLEKMTASLNLSAEQSDIKGIVSSDLKKQRARQGRKYHSKRGARRAGRPQGSKAKQETRLKLDKSGVWE